jgi:hypothetical protein
VATARVEGAVAVPLASVTEAGLIEHVGGSVPLVGETLQVKVTVPVKPLAATVAVVMPGCPGVAMVIDVGLAETANLALPPVTVMGAVPLEPI